MLLGTAVASASGPKTWVRPTAQEKRAITSAFRKGRVKMGYGRTLYSIYLPAKQPFAHRWAVACAPAPGHPGSVIGRGIRRATTGWVALSNKTLMNVTGGRDRTGAYPAPVYTALRSGLRSCAAHRHMHVIAKG